MVGCRASLSEVNDSICAAYECRFVKTKVLTCFCSPMPSSNATALQSLEAVLVEMAWTKGSLEIYPIPMAARLRSTRAVMPEKAGAASQVWNAERSSGCWIAPKLGLRARRNRRHGRNLGQDGHATRSSFSNVHNFGKMWNSSF